MFKYRIEHPLPEGWLTTLHPHAEHTGILPATFPQGHCRQHPYLAHAESQVLPWSPLLGVTDWAPQEMDSDPHRLSFLPGVYQKCPKDQCLLEARIARGTCQASSQGALEPEWTQAERAGPLTLRQNGCWMEPHGRAWPW